MVSGEYPVYDVMLAILNEPSVMDDVSMVNDDGEPVLPKLPVFIISEDYEEWMCCWYNVRQWSPVFDPNPIERERMILTAIAWTARGYGVG